MPRARRNRSSIAVAIQPATRCAIYTRKSTDEGLDRDFNSLDAQREIAASYVASQRHDGWTALAERYDDGGFSGANTNRPALRRLLADVEAGKIDCVVAYRYDRLSRSMLDFLQMLEFFKRHDVEFVSVSERFDTSVPHGEMALNLVMSMAQCERKIISQRTRDKMRAARRRGKWTGGCRVLGYDPAPEGGKLIVNVEEADQVRTIFELYTEKGSLMAVIEELNRRGWRNKSWVAKTGRRCGGGEWNKISLRRLLTDPLSTGKQKLGDEVFEGEHKAIVSEVLFHKVQDLIAQNRGNGGAAARNRHGALLRGLLRCKSCDCAMTFAPTRKGRQLYRYYRCSKAMKRGATTCPAGCIRADTIETFVVDQIRRIGSSTELQEETFQQAMAQVAAERRGLKAEAKRLERDLVLARKNIESLVATLTDTKGAARDAVQTELAKAQERIHTMETRLVEVRDLDAELAAHKIDQVDLVRALEAFDPIWEVLLTPEKERVLKLLIERIDYDGADGEMAIQWRLAGFGQLAEEVGT